MNLGFPVTVWFHHNPVLVWCHRWSHRWSHPKQGCQVETQHWVLDGRELYPETILLGLFPWFPGSWPDSWHLVVALVSHLTSSPRQQREFSEQPFGFARVVKYQSWHEPSNQAGQALSRSLRSEDTKNTFESGVKSATCLHLFFSSQKTK